MGASRGLEKIVVVGECPCYELRGVAVTLEAPVEICLRMVAHAKIKTDTIDAGVLAQRYASGFLPEVWIPDEATQALRRQVTRRNQIVRQRTRLKNIIQSILHARPRTCAAPKEGPGSTNRSCRRTSVSLSSGI